MSEDKLGLSERTPGPWENVWDYPPEEGADSDEPWGIRAADGTVVVGAFWYDGPQLMLREPDARLIAAAPDLLRALEMVRDADDDCERDGLPRIPAPARARIDAAIAKATGKDAA